MTAKNEVKILPYQSRWAGDFQEIAHQLKIILGDELIECFHIGSTSIQDLPAKPIIDVIPIVKDVRKIDAYNTAFEQINLSPMGEYGIPFRRYFKRQGLPFATNVHIYEQDNVEVNRLLLFRDYLRKHEDKKVEYAKLKEELAQHFPNDIFHYCMGKTQFIEQIDNAAGFKGFRMVEALSEEEKKCFVEIAQQTTALSESDIKEINESFQSKNHYCFVLRDKFDIVGAAKIKMRSEAEIEIFGVSANDSESRRAQSFLKLLEKWTVYQGKNKVIVKYSNQNKTLFLNQGFYLENQCFIKNI